MTSKNTKRYQKKDPIEHILTRSDMYVGSTRLRSIQEYLGYKEDNKYHIVSNTIQTSPAILRIFVEALSNAIDNVERSKNSGTPCTKIKVSINPETGETSVWNDGDVVPIEIEPDEKCYIHSMIFGQLLTGSNYDDEEERIVSGRNGLGGKLCLKKGTLVPKFDGNVMKIEDINIGDEVIGDDGTKRIVINKCEGNGRLFEISQPRGKSYIVNEEHLLSLRMPDHKVIFWNTSKNGWSISWLDKISKTIHSKSISVLPPKIQCPECHSFLSGNLNRHYSRVHKDTSIPVITRSSPTIIPPDIPGVQETLDKMKEFANTISDDNTLDISVKDYIKLTPSMKSRLSGYMGDCVMWDEKPVKLDPYVLGLWLGDGYKNGYGFAINSSEDPEILEYLNEWGSKNDAKFTQGLTNLVAYSISSVTKSRRAPLKKLLEEYDLVNNKHIPLDYIVNSPEIRLAVLAGLIDSDGTVRTEGRRIIIAQGMEHSRLANDIVFLAKTLGFMCSYHIKKTQWKYQGEFRSGNAININISGNGVEDIPTKIPRKKCFAPLKRECTNTGKLTVREVDMGEYVGLEVDGPSKRFVLEDFTVTHNCNVFSTNFRVSGCDPKNGKTLVQEWTNNMRDTKGPVVKDSKLKKGYTEVCWTPDFQRFGLTKYTPDIVRLYTRYVLDAAMLSKVDVYLNNELIPVHNITDYAALYETPTEEKLYIKTKDAEVLLMPAKEFQTVSFVNGVYTRLGGKHVESWSEALFRPIVDKFNGKDKKTKTKTPKINITDVKQFFRLIVVATVIRPEFDGQDKNCLESPTVEAEVKRTHISTITKWSVMDQIEDIIRAKEMVVLKKAEKVGKKTKIEGYDPANKAGGKDSTNCALFITEGLSAKTYVVAGLDVGIYGRQGRDWNGVLPVRGKLLNVRDKTATTIADNKVICSLIHALGLKCDVDYTIDTNFKKLNYGRLVIVADADCFTKDTPLLIKSNNNIDIITCENLYKLNNIDSIEIWSHKGWTSIKGIKKKETTKNVLQITTACGLIRCTEDHKMILENGDEILANQLKVGDSLLRTRRIEKPTTQNTDTYSYTQEIMDKYQCYKKTSSRNILDMKKAIETEGYFCHPINTNNCQHISAEEAFVWGMFFSEGTCDVYRFIKDRSKQTVKNTENSRKRWEKWVEKYENRLVQLSSKDILTKNEKKLLSMVKTRLKNAEEMSLRTSIEKNEELWRVSYSWNISNCNRELLEKCYNIMVDIYPEHNWSIIECQKRDEKHQTLYKLLLNGGKKTIEFITKFREMFYDSTNRSHKKVPVQILNSTKDIQQAFLDGYYEGDGFRCLKQTKNASGFDILGQIGAQGMCFILERLGYCVNVHNSKRDIFTIHFSNRYRRLYPGAVKNIKNIEYNDFVYDIETENHQLNAGVGGLVVHNCDGIHIEALLMNFIHTLYPSLLKRNQPFFISLKTPIARIKQSRLEDKLFYDENNFNRWLSQQTKKVDIKYYKGLGTTKSEDVPDTFGKKLVEFEEDENTSRNMQKAFNKKYADARKEWLADYIPSETKFKTLDEMEQIDKMSISNFIDGELIKFSHADCARSIPSGIDGLKESQRKILYAVKKRKLKYSGKSLKVAQLAGYTAEHSNYHHGENNLFDTIIGMAHEYPGTNNIPLLYRDGQFGSRLEGGDDAAAARYIYTKMDALTEYIYREEDESLLTPVNDDGDLVQPVHYIPILPMILINGCAAGIGTGWSCNVPCFNPLDMIKAIKVWLENDGEVLIENPECPEETISMFADFVPWYRGFKGDIEKSTDTRFITYGIVEEGNKDEIHIKELPIGMWTSKFADYCDDLKSDKKLKSVSNYSSPKDVHFVVKEGDDFHCDLNTMKLHSYLYTSNMVTFNEKEQLRKYDTVDQILDNFCKVRYEYYVKRKKHQLNALEVELRFLGNKERFVSEVISSELNIMNVEEEELIKELKNRGYDEDPKKEEGEGGYDYLLRMPVRSLTANKVKQLKNDIASTQEKLDGLRATTEQAMWLKELDEFEKAYVNWVDEINNQVVVVKKQTKKKK